MVRWPSGEFPFAPCFFPTGKPSCMNPSVRIASPCLGYFQSIWGKSYFTDCSLKHARQYTNKIERTGFASLLPMFGTMAYFSFPQLLFFLLCWNPPSVKVGRANRQNPGHEMASGIWCSNASAVAWAMFLYLALTLRQGGRRNWGGSSKLERA